MRQVKHLEIERKSLVPNKQTLAHSGNKTAASLLVLFLVMNVLSRDLENLRLQSLTGLELLLESPY